MKRTLQFSSDDVKTKFKRGLGGKNIDHEKTFDFKEVFILTKWQVEYVINKIEQEKLVLTSNRNHPLLLNKQVLLTLHPLVMGYRWMKSQQ